ncbi:GGDEF domain-containing protein [Neptuniibacter sp.]|uniref:GGDEF domain-containing protein n=1 Tax=Neptuniibacter sp. TaxID=1962643 RepID=UPI002615ECB6|nr:diguanylate cyclase [Neptuniibacter sp.]MCP4596719.1 diguanylate cyclase [Neptuniibacter sp.]
MNPENLSSSSDLFLKRFCITALLSALVLMILTGYTVSHQYEKYVVQLAESNAERLATSIAKAHRQELDSALQKAPLLPPQLIELDRTLRAFIAPYDLVKIKLFSLDGVVIYSTDMSIIGKRSLDNKSLNIALQGDSSSSIQHKGQIRDLQNEERFDVDVVESYVALKSLSGEVVGAFEIYQDMTEFHNDIRQGVIVLAAIVLTILVIILFIAMFFMRKAAKQMIRQQRQLEQLATVDMVTNVYNRAEITRRLEAEWERCKRQEADGKKVGLMMLDLDHFKQFNDRFGHQVGDGLLRQVAHRLQGELRLYSDLGRYGGEEFMVLVPEITPNGLKSIASRILKLISEEPFTVNTHELKVTISIGCAVAKPSDMHSDELIKRADNRLYAAKNAGRNCVIGADEPAP